MGSPRKLETRRNVRLVYLFPGVRPCQVAVGWPEVSISWHAAYTTKVSLQVLVTGSFPARSGLGFVSVDANPKMFHFSVAFPK